MMKCCFAVQSEGIWEILVIGMKGDSQKIIRHRMQNSNNSPSSHLKFIFPENFAGKVTAPESQCIKFTVTSVQFAPRESGICRSWVEFRTDLNVLVGKQWVLTGNTPGNSGIIPPFYSSKSRYATHKEGLVCDLEKFITWILYSKHL